MDALETGWALEGHDTTGEPISLLVGETWLRRAYLGVTVGRLAEICDLVLPDPGISRRHFRLSLATDRAAETQLAIEDLNSLNGTIVVGARLAPFQPTPVVDGTEIVVGQLLLTVRRVGESD